jgi:histidinol-phosphate aminotransferase
MERVIEFPKLEAIKNYEANKVKYNNRLDANESFIPIDQRLLNKFMEKLGEIELHRYPDSDSEALRALYADYCGVDKSNIIVGNGSDELIQVIINGVLRKGDKLLTFKPDFSMYRFYTNLVEGDVVELELDENMETTAEKIINKAVEENIKLIIFSNPNNPTGSALPNKEIIKIVENCNALVVIDEAYYEFYGETMVDYINEFDNLVVLRTSSKALGLAASRLGFLIAKAALVSKIVRAKAPYNVNALTQALGEIVLNERRLIEENVKNIIAEREYLFQQLKKIEGNLKNEKFFKVFPSKANFIYIKSCCSEKIYRRLLEMSINIRIFKDNSFRITAGSDEENKALIDGLNKILEVKP